MTSRDVKVAVRRNTHTRLIRYCKRSGMKVGAFVDMRLAEALDRVEETEAAGKEVRQTLGMAAADGGN